MARSPEPGNGAEKAQQRASSDLEFGGPDLSYGHPPFKRDPGDTLEVRADLERRSWVLRGRGPMAAISTSVLGIAIIWGWSGNDALGTTSLSVLCVLTALHLVLQRRAPR